MEDIKVIDTLKGLEHDRLRQERNADLPFHPLALFAEAVGMTRQEATGVSIADIAKCFKHQFDEAELAALIRELSNPLTKRE